MTKTVLYLDQSYISNLMRARFGTDQFPSTPAWWAPLLAVLSEEVKAERVVCPISPYHFTESELAPHLEQAIYDTLEGLSCGLQFRSFPEIVRSQTTAAYMHFVGAHSTSPTWQQAYNRDPQDACDLGFKIERSRAYFTSWTRQVREYHERVGLLPPVGNVQQSRVHEALQFVKDMYFRPLFAVFTGQIDITTLSGLDFMAQLLRDFKEVHDREPTGPEVDDLMMRFLPGLALSPTPYIDIYSTVIATIVVNHQSRIVQGSDLQDVMAASMAVPYCHIFTTDSFMKDVLRTASLDQQYSVEIYSPRRVDVEALTEKLSAA